MFTGYTGISGESEITVLTTESEVVQALADGDRGTVIVNETPFYATMGGQEGDTGVIRTAGGEFCVETTIPLRGGRIGHVGRVVSGMLKVGDRAELLVSGDGRHATEKNHSATHLLQKALKVVLGDHVEQKGSYVDPARLRFDFVHFKPMTREEIEQVEQIAGHDDGQLRLRLYCGGEPAELLGPVARVLHEHQVPVTELSPGSATLEDVFIDLTGRELR